MSPTPRTTGDSKPQRKVAVKFGSASTRDTSMDHLSELKGWAQIKAIFALAGPAMFGMLSQNLLNIVDTKMVGSLGPHAIAAQSVSGVTVFMVVAFLGALSVGTQALVARRKGEGDLTACGKVLDNTLIIASLAGMVIIAPCFIFAHHIIDFFASDPEVKVIGLPYMRWRYLGIIFFVFGVAFRGFFNGLGATWIYMYVAWGMNLFNIAANYCLIHGNLGFPALGLEGAGLGTAMSNFVGALGFAWFTTRPPYRIAYQPWSLKNIDLDQIRRIARLSLPSAIEGLLLLSSFALFSKMQGMVSTVHQAATGITITFFALVFLPAVGIGQAGGAIVGQQLGARKYHAVGQSVQQLLRISFVTSSCTALLFSAFGAPLFSFFTDDIRVIETGRGTLAILGMFCAIDAASLVLSHILQSAGLTSFVMFAHAGSSVTVFVPLTYLFAYRWGHGALGGFFAFGIYITFYLLLLVWRYRLDDWKYREI